MSDDSESVWAWRLGSGSGSPSKQDAHGAACQSPGTSFNGDGASHSTRKAKSTASSKSHPSAFSIDSILGYMHNTKSKTDATVARGPAGES